jgi:secernin
MCDTLCGPGVGGMVFAKNSDRPVGEVQLAVPFGRRPTAGCILHTQYLSIGDTGAHAALLSCPTWLWGAEHGVNEYGVAIGNERVATVHNATQAPPRLIGMDLVRLGLERARSAREALDILVELLTTHGQGGIADAAHQEAYDSSFLIADPAEAFVLDTSGTDFAAAPFPRGTAISNRLSVGSGWTRASPDLDPGEDFGRFRDPAVLTDSADQRLSASRRFMEGERAKAGGLTPAATAGHLRDHGNGPGSGSGVCMHPPGRSVTAASLIAVLPTEVAAGAPLRAYVALGSPCVSIYVPAFVRTATGPPPFVPKELSNEAMWWAADALRQRVEEDPAAIGPIREVLDPVEEELWFEAGQIAETPDRWPDVAGSWGGRALAALQSCAP